MLPWTQRKLALHFIIPIIHTIQLPGPLRCRAFATAAALYCCPARTSAFPPARLPLVVFPRVHFEPADKGRLAVGQLLKRQLAAAEGEGGGGARRDAPRQRVGEVGWEGEQHLALRQPQLVCGRVEGFGGGRERLKDPGEQG